MQLWTKVYCGYCGARFWFASNAEKHVSLTHKKEN